MTLSSAQIWIVIAGLALGTFLVRFSFLGHRRRSALAEVAPASAALHAGGGHSAAWSRRWCCCRRRPAAALDPARLIAAAATLALGLVARNTLIAIIGGAATLYAMLWASG